MSSRSETPALTAKKPKVTTTNFHRKSHIRTVCDHCKELAECEMRGSLGWPVMCEIPDEMDKKMMGEIDNG